MLQSSMSSQYSIVRLHNSGGNLGGRIDGELQLRLLAIVHGETLHQQRGESRSSSSSEGMEEKESLEASTLVSKLPDSVQDQINDLLSNGVVTPGIVVGGVLLSIDELLGMVELTVSSNSSLVNDSRLQVYEDSSWNMISTSSLREESLEGVVSEGLVRGHMTIGLDPMLEAVELPTSIANLTAGLADMDRDTLTLETNVCC